MDYIYDESNEHRYTFKIINANIIDNKSFKVEAYILFDGNNTYATITTDIKLSDKDNLYSIRNSLLEDYRRTSIFSSIINKIL